MYMYAEEIETKRKRIDHMMILSQRLRYSDT